MAKPKILKSNLSVTLVLVIVAVVFLYGFSSTGKFTGTFNELDCSNPSTFSLDSDGDSDALPDVCEKIVGTNPVIADTDGDGCLDGHELGTSDPLIVDCVN